VEKKTQFQTAMMLIIYLYYFLIKDKKSQVLKATTVVVFSLIIHRKLNFHSMRLENE
jgi:hypothetical protein